MREWDRKRRYTLDPLRLVRRLRDVTPTARGLPGGGARRADAVILAKGGAGKSYLVKLEALRSLYHGIDVAVMDPDGEYRRLAGAAGGAYLALGAPGVRLNPLTCTRRP